MYCHKCDRFTLPIDHLNESGNLNKLSFKCLKKPRLSSQLFTIDDLDELQSLEVLPLSYILMPNDGITDDYTFEEFCSDTSDLIFEKTGLKFRYISRTFTF